MTLCRIDRYETNEHGQEIGYSDWIGGPTISNVKNAHVLQWQDAPADAGGGRYVDTGLRRAARITGEPNTWFSVPAQISLNGKTVKGWLGTDDGLWQFHTTRS